MSIKEGPSRRVSFDMREELNDKIDKLTVMIGKLAAKDSGRTRQFNCVSLSFCLIYSI